MLKLDIKELFKLSVNLLDEYDKKGDNFEDNEEIKDILDKIKVRSIIFINYLKYFNYELNLNYS